MKRQRRPLFVAGLTRLTRLETRGYLSELHHITGLPSLVELSLKVRNDEMTDESIEQLAGLTRLHVLHLDHMGKPPTALALVPLERLQLERLHLAPPLQSPELLPLSLRAPWLKAGRRERSSYEGEE